LVKFLQIEKPFNYSWLNLYLLAKQATTMETKKEKKKKEERGEEEREKKKKEQKGKEERRRGKRRGEMFLKSQGKVGQ
jgi:hypothetical protein